VVKRAADERKRLPPELEAFARSQDERLRVKRPRVDRGRLNDPREGYVIPGVSNRDARAVFDVRAEAMRGLWAGGELAPEAQVELRRLLHDAQRLGLWRARRLTDFAAFVEDVLGIPGDRAAELVREHTFESRETEELLTERDVALWLRTEAGLYEGDEAARARIRTTTGGIVLELSIALSNASAGLSGAGVRHAPLARERAEAMAGREGRYHEEAGEGAAPRVMVEAPGAAGVGESVERPQVAQPILGGARLLKRKMKPMDDAAAEDGALVADDRDAAPVVDSAEADDGDGGDEAPVAEAPALRRPERPPAPVRTRAARPFAPREDGGDRERPFTPRFGGERDAPRPRRAGFGGEARPQRAERPEGARFAGRGEAPRAGRFQRGDRSAERAERPARASLAGSLAGLAGSPAARASLAGSLAVLAARPADSAGSLAVLAARPADSAGSLAARASSAGSLAVLAARPADSAGSLAARASSAGSLAVLAASPAAARRPAATKTERTPWASSTFTPI